jgi:chloride channel 3/4/5
LPYLDSKNEYIHHAAPASVLDADVPTIVLDEENTIGSLKEKIVELQNAHGFPILARDHDGHGDGGARLMGYISARDLSSGLQAALASESSVADDSTTCVFRSGTIREEEEEEGARGGRVVDLSYLIDVAPITVNIRSPMELLQELFVKLGVRYLVVVDERGMYRGVIEKNR